MSFEESMKEMIEGVVNEMDLEEKVIDALPNLDDLVGEKVDKAVDELDISDKINDAVRDHDFTDDVQDAVKDEVKEQLSDMDWDDQLGDMIRQECGDELDEQLPAKIDAYVDSPKFQEKLDAMNRASLARVLSGLLLSLPNAAVVQVKSDEVATLP